MRPTLAYRFAHMVDHIDDASEPRGRVDIRVGVGRRRRWSVAEATLQAFKSSLRAVERYRQHVLTWEEIGSGK